VRKGVRTAEQFGEVNEFRWVQALERREGKRKEGVKGRAVIEKTGKPNIKRTKNRKILGGGLGCWAKRRPKGE